jgi:hypothetical protein
MNLNELARLITLQEGLKKNVSIAQVKEIMRLTFSALANMPFGDAAKILSKYQ